jgi:hypothetical protein
VPRRTIRRWGAGTLGLAIGALLTSSAALAIDIEIGGVDAETRYTASTGVLSFDDATGTPGLVTTSEIPGMVGAEIDLELMLDTSSFDPATGDVRDAVFIGTGAGPEITIRSGEIVLLALDVSFVEVTSAAHSGSPTGQPDGKITLGNPLFEEYGITSVLTVAGGTMSDSYGGVGQPATLHLFMSSLNPKMTKSLRNSGFLGLDFTNGLGTTAESTTWNITVDPPLVPEPGTAALLGAALLGLAAAARRRRPR